MLRPLTCSIIGLYVSFILMIARLLRVGFVGLYRNIQYMALPYVDRIYGYFEDFYLCREMGLFQLEEEFYAKIAFLYRSPETMVRVTRRPVPYKTKY